MSSLPISSAINKGESVRRSFLRDGTNQDLIAHLVCSLLNSVQGGAVHIGVSKDGSPVGLSVSKISTHELEASLREKISPTALFSVSVDQLSGGDVISIDVPAGSDRPYISDGTIWIRHHTIAKPAIRDDIQDILEDMRKRPQRWERRISFDAAEDELDNELIWSVWNNAQKAGRLKSNESIETPLDFLTEISCARIKGVTNAGDVTFAKRPDKRHPQTRVQLLEYSNDKTDNSMENSRWFEGPVLRVADQIFQALQAHNKTRGTFRKGSIKRSDQLAYDDFVLREGIVNALAHRDYESFSGGVKVRVYPDRIEFWNSGRLNKKIKVRDLPKKHESFPNNPDITKIFYLSVLMEQSGRGGEKIAQACKDIGAPPPVWTDTNSGVTLTIYASLSQDQAIAKHLNQRQRQFVEKVKIGETVSVSEYLTIFADSVSVRTARRELAELESYRLVRREGQSVATIYRRI